MQMPKPSAPAVALFERLTPKRPDVTSRPVFGQPAAFVGGNMFFGVFGDDLFVRLSEPDAADARGSHGFAPFEPMPGRPMTGYLVLPAQVRSDPSAARAWVAKALHHTARLPPKEAKRAKRK